ncbi:hypothetical protein QBC41DRAFT_216817 [Cercophora samala]|uniref:RRM domain-containing protein n=1 Tax=Cercophora samala TaxID=330535 RepID=A0AA39ZK86_9PEZI|nr:hypothetical protein QBC41DRAFT_216817 [Cercophora samala]
MSTNENNLPSRTSDTEGDFSSPNSFVYVRTPLATISNNMGLKPTVQTTPAEDMKSSNHEGQHHQYQQQYQEQHQQQYRQPSYASTHSSLAHEIHFDQEESPPPLKDNNGPFEPASPYARDQSHGGLGINTEESFPHQEQPGTRTVSSPVGTNAKYSKTTEQPHAEVNWRDRSVSYGASYGGRGASYLRGPAATESYGPSRFYPPGYYFSPANRWNPNFRSYKSASASTDLLASLTSNARRNPFAAQHSATNRFNVFQTLNNSNNIDDDDDTKKMSHREHFGVVGDGRFGGRPTSSAPAPPFHPSAGGSGHASGRMMMTHPGAGTPGFAQPQPSAPAYHPDALSSQLSALSFRPGPASTVQAPGPFPAAPGPHQQQHHPFPGQQRPFFPQPSAAPFFPAGFRPLASVPETAVVRAGPSSSGPVVRAQEQGRPFFFRPMECRTHRRLTELESYDLMIKGFSPNYKGNPDLDRNRSATIPENMNCSLFLVGLPANLTTHELLAGVRNVGRVYATHINPPEPEKGHEQSAAKIVFFERSAAGMYPLCVPLVLSCLPSCVNRPSKSLGRPLDYLNMPQIVMERFYHLTTTLGFRIPTRPPPNHPVRVTWNRIRSAEVDVNGSKSRVLLISGPPHIVNEEHLREYFDGKLIYQVDEVIVHHPGAVPAALPAPPGSSSGGSAAGLSTGIPSSSGGPAPAGLLAYNDASSGVPSGGFLPRASFVAGHSNTSSGGSAPSSRPGGYIPGFNDNFPGGSVPNVAGHSNTNPSAGPLIPGNINNSGASGFVPGHTKTVSSISSGGHRASSLLGQLKGDRALIEFRFGSYRCQSEAARMALVREFREFGVLCEFGKDPCDRVEEEEQEQEVVEGKGKEREMVEEGYHQGNLVGGETGGVSGEGDGYPYGYFEYDGAAEMEETGGDVGMGGGAFAGGAGVGGGALAGGSGGFGSVFTPGAGAHLTATTPAGSFFQSRAQSDSVRALWNDARR